MAGQLVTMKIRSVDPAAPTTIYESAAYTFHFSKKDVPGAIYYWSTTVAGVRRGAMGDPGPTNFYTPLQANGKCVACHTLSKNGKVMAADVGGESLGVVQVSTSVPPPVNFGPTGAPPTNYASAWATFDPDAKFVVQSKQGVMTLRDAKTGTTVGANSGVIALGLLGIQPDWSYDGKHIVFAQANKDRGGGTTLRWINTTVGATDVTYGTVESLVPAAAGTLYGYPMFNPTNDTIAFVKGKSIEKDLTDQFHIIKAATGAQTLVPLTRANTLVSDGTVANGIENNMPTWAPTGGPDVQWIAFASRRDYGFVLETGSKIGADKQQLWIAAIDVSKLGTGVDPSFPAFRVPFVELSENAHRPFWALDALAPPPGDGGTGDVDAGACVPLNGDCTTGICCAGTQCYDDGSGNNYSCRIPVN